VPKTINCEFCDAEFVRTGMNQRTCTDKACKKKLRAKTRSELYYRKKEAPICVWCDKPIRERRKRQYHKRCRQDKNRLRAMEYWYRSQEQPRTTEKKPRNYKGKLFCKFCRKLVKRTGARQIICKKIECKRKLKNLRKRERNAERRALPERINKAREKKQKPQPILPDYRVYKIAKERSIGA
jgi:hypothetical protein